MTLKEKLQYIKDAGFELTDRETEDMLSTYVNEAVEEAVRGFIKVVDKKIEFIGYMDMETDSVSLPQLRKWVDEYLQTLKDKDDR